MNDEFKVKYWKFTDNGREYISEQEYEQIMNSPMTEEQQKALEVLENLASGSLVK